LVAAAGRLARHFAASEIAPELTRRAPAHALNAKQPQHASLDLQHPGTLHDRHAADDGRTRRGLRIARVRRCKPGHPRWRSTRLGPTDGGLGDVVVPNARRPLASGHAPCGVVVVVADPHADDDIVGESDEPRVLVALARPGLALDWAVDPGRAPRALAHDAREKIVNSRACGRIACRRELRLLPREHNALAVAYFTDRVRLDAFRVGRDRGERARHFQ